MTKLHRLPQAGILLLAAVMLALPVQVLAQDQALSRAKNLYESAEYEEALQLLATLKGKTSGSEVAAYQVFCLVALGRQDEAKAAVEAIVREDPLYRPAEGAVSPRIRLFFEDIRKPLLPEIASTSYTKAKTAFDKKEWATAQEDFNRSISILDEMAQTDEGVKDLRTLAVGFRDLTTAAIKTEAPPPAPTPSPTPTVPAAAAKPEPVIYGDQHDGIVRPVPIARTMPPWLPNPIEQRMTFAGAIEVIVNEQGKVELATMQKPAHPRYDTALIEAAKGWTFKPATKDGVAVKYRYVLAINLSK